MEFAWSLVAAFVGGLIGASAKEVVSWLFKEKTRKIAERNAIKQLIAESIQTTKELSSEYWEKHGSDKDCAVLCAKITAKLHFVAKLYPTILTTSTKIMRDMDVEFVGFRKACSGGAFGNADREPDIGRIGQIELAASQLHGEFILLDFRKK